MNINESRHPAAIWHNELGNRCLEMREMFECAHEHAKEQNDPLCNFLAWEYYHREVDSMKAEMVSIENRFFQDEYWDDHWLEDP